ncbi:hypothetical protein D3OALGA1CA_2173 [Olavius algarvensis associated proteobacterium Delta 3]|nr:hypothetical protein D3OALGA1CA_2173 [Olavius algarvensis associated proteobacterium Delta 3]CAB5161716.1 hypothetical protein D3OALGB2SA_5471 [Olavius algarvensis associated proteobacterium Delta 3]
MTKESVRNRRLVGVFLLGILLFNYPVLSLFNLTYRIFGIPLLYLYTFLAWAVIIGLIALVTKVKVARPKATGNTD